MSKPGGRLDSIIFQDKFRQVWELNYLPKIIPGRTILGRNLFRADGNGQMIAKHWGRSFGDDHSP